MSGRQRVLQAFAEAFGDEPQWMIRAPGRVCVLGAHVDYNQGWVLAGAIDRSLWLAARPASSDKARILALDYEDTTEIDGRWLPPPVPERRGGGDDLAGWDELARGVFWALARAGYAVAPIDAVLGGDLPIGAGVSSSAAVEVALLLACEAAGGFELSGRRRSEIGRRVENEYLGVSSGVMDQFTSIHGAADSLLLLDCRSLDFDRVPLPSDLAVLVADSGVRRRLAESDYNRRPEECRQATAALALVVPGLESLRDLSSADLAEHAGVLTPALHKRARHVVEECERVRQGAEALRQGKVRVVGELMNASHASSRDLYEVSLPELDLLAHSAASASGCYGARLSGAGFGGCVVALIKAAAAEAVAARMSRDFERAFGRSAPSFCARIGAGAEVEPV